MGDFVKQIEGWFPKLASTIGEMLDSKKAAVAIAGSTVSVATIDNQWAKAVAVIAINGIYLIVQGILDAKKKA